MSSKEYKPQIYYLIRRGWYGQLVRYCDEIIGMKGKKDPLVVYWKAYGLGMIGKIHDCLNLLDGFSSRRDMQYAVSLALLFFKSKEPNIDHEAIDTIRNELSVAEDVTKEAGMVLAARFALYTANTKEASRICQKLTKNSVRGGNASSAYEVEAFCIEHWCILCDAQSNNKNLSSENVKKLQNVDSVLNENSAEHYDVDTLMMWAQTRLILNKPKTEQEVLNILNIIIASFSWFLPALADKALTLATIGEWEQALDTAQRLLDSPNSDFYQLDALQVIAVHAFTQDCHMDDAVEKFEELANAMEKRDPGAVAYAVSIAALFSNICARQPRALQICVRILQRAREVAFGGSGNSSTSSPASVVNAWSDEGSLLSQLGYIHIMQGQGHLELAMKIFREATKKDPNNLKALEGMVLCQLSEGAYEDAESQIELLSLMNSPSNLGYEFLYFKALLMSKGHGTSAPSKSDSNSMSLTKANLEALDECRAAFLSTFWDIGNGEVFSTKKPFSLLSMPTYSNSFQNLMSRNPDFVMILAIEYLSHMESTVSATSYLPATNSLVSNVSTSNDRGGANLLFTQQTTKQTIGNPTAGGLTVNNNTLGTVNYTNQTMTTYGGKLPAEQDTTSVLGAAGAVSATLSGGSFLASAEVSATVQCGIDLLQTVLQVCPGFISAYIELSRCHSSVSAFEEASRVLQKCLTLQSKSAAVLLAMAKVEIGRFNTATADRMLEQALGCDFSIRSANLFRLIKSFIRSQQGRLDEAMAEVEQLLATPEFGFTLTTSANAGPNTSSVAGKRFTSTSSISSSSVPSIQATSSSLFGNYSDTLRLTADDRVAAYVVYAALLSRLRRMKEANKVLSQAKVIFAGSSQEVQVLIASSQLSVEKGDFDTAIRMLDKIPKDSPTYSKAQILKADILLNNNHDKEGFTKTYQQLADSDPTAKNYSMLGEAYLRILNPEAAIEALEKAYKIDPSNGRLRGRIGRALVATHEYHRAIEFYEAAIREVSKNLSQTNNSKQSVKSSDLITLSHDLAKLYIKLGRAESSSRVLVNILHQTSHDAVSMKQDVVTLMLLSRVQEMNDPGEVMNTLLDAYKIQKDLVGRVRSSVIVSSGDSVEREKTTLSDICHRIGNCYIEAGENPTAVQMFTESLQHNSQNTSSMLGLAKISLSRGETDVCISYCEKIVLFDPNNESATLLLSEALFHQSELKASSKVDSTKEDSKSSNSGIASSGLKTGIEKSQEQISVEMEKAVAPLRSLLKLQPNNYLVLEKFISLLRRAGKLEEAMEFIGAAEKGNPRYLSHAGYHYALGMYSKYTNDVGRAISEFNLARKDDLWGASALTCMIELFLNPDQEGVWEEKDQSGPLDEATRANIAAAEELLRELRPIAKDPLRVAVLENYCALATRHKPNVDRAMQSFAEMLDKDQDCLPAVLGMSTGFMIEKNQHKARNLLKRIGKMELNQQDGDDFEKANLLLAKFYIDKSKPDLAEELCMKTLAQNRSCSQAWEILGLIMEKDSNYELASNHYEKAWKLEFEASASVGFKLGFCYLKSKKYIDAIDVCEKVLELYPDYPRISEEILKKAQQTIRTV